MNRFRVLVVDDNDFVRRCIVDLICQSGDIEVVAEAADGRTAVELAKQLIPDVVIMDVNMPLMDGIEASRTICSELPQIQVIGLSMFQKSEMGDKMLQAGAAAYFSKTDPWDEVLAGIHQVLMPEQVSGGFTGSFALN